MKKPIKICKNPNCKDEIVDYKSTKRKFCSDSCRNSFGYLKRLEENREFIEHKNGMKNNYKLLKMFEDAKIYKEEFSKLVKLGFSTKYLPEFRVFIINDVKCKCYQIKDIIFSLSADGKNILIHNLKLN